MRPTVALLAFAAVCITACSAEQAATEPQKPADFFSDVPDHFPPHLADMKSYKPTQEEIDAINDEPSRIDGKPNDYARNYGDGKSSFLVVSYICSERYEPAYFPHGFNNSDRYRAEALLSDLTTMEMDLKGAEFFSKACDLQCDAYNVVGVINVCGEAKKAHSRNAFRYGADD